MIALIRYLAYFLVILFTVTTFFPIALLRPFNPVNNVNLFIYFNFLAEKLLNMKIHIEGQDLLKEYQPCILIGNHQHNYDAFTVAKFFVYKMAIIAKFELALIPIFGWVFALCGNILIKRSNSKKARASMSRAQKKIIKERISIFVFPEGHRNPSTKLLKLKKGAFYMAINTKLPLVHFSMSNYLEHNNFNSFKRINIFVKVHSPIDTTNLDLKDIPRLINQSKNLIEAGIIEMNEKHLAFNRRNQG